MRERLLEAACRLVRTLPRSRLAAVALEEAAALMDAQRGLLAALVG
jgi:hypothetical protein